MNILMRENMEEKLNELFIDMIEAEWYAKEFRFGGFQGAVRLAYGIGMLSSKEFTFLGNAARYVYSTL